MESEVPPRLLALVRGLDGTTNHSGQFVRLPVVLTVHLSSQAPSLADDHQQTDHLGRDREER